MHGVLFDLDICPFQLESFAVDNPRCKVVAKVSVKNSLNALSGRAKIKSSGYQLIF
jgi:hypothetical protein